jgi:hypothetical protein
VTYVAIYGVGDGGLNVGGVGGTVDSGVVVKFYIKIFYDAVPHWLSPGCSHDVDLQTYMFHFPLALSPRLHSSQRRLSSVSYFVSAVHQTLICMPLSFFAQPHLYPETGYRMAVIHMRIECQSKSAAQNVQRR